MKNFLLIIAFTAAFTGTLLAQKKESAEADEHFRHKNYASALPRYLELLKTYPDDGSLNYKTGACYLASRSLKRLALPYLEKAAANSPSHHTKAYPGESEAPADVYQLLGDAYYLTYNFDKALHAYEQYEQLLKEGKPAASGSQADIQTQIRMCRLIKELKPVLSLPISAKTGQPCGETLVKGEYTSSLSPDKTHMVYTVKVPLEKVSSFDDAAFYEIEALASGNDSAKRKTPRKNLEKDSVVYASTIGASYDGQVVLTYRNESGNGNLYISKLRDNKWTNPVKMKKVANTAGWEPNECVSPDGNTLYFTSKRAGGYGGSDLYYCKKLPNGEWSKARNLGPAVNSPADEEAPFIHPDNNTLYFSSNRVLEGSYDIFASNHNGRVWSKPVNVGFPVNRNDQDIFQVDADRKKVYPAPQPGSGKFAEKENQDTSSMRVLPDRENFLISFISQQQTPLTVMKGVVKDEGGHTPGSADILITDNNSGELISKQYSDGATGLYSFVLPPGRNLNITFELPGHLFRSENVEVSQDKRYFEKNKAIQLPLIREGAKTSLRNIFFDKDHAEPGSSSGTELKRIADLLKNNPGIEIKLSSHLSTENNKRFYKGLSKQRAKAVSKALAALGADKKRISYKGYWHRLPEEETEDSKQVKKKQQPKPPKRRKKEERPPLQEFVLEIKDIEKVIKNQQ